MKRTTHNYGHRWTQAQVKRLMEMWGHRASVETIAAKLDVTKNAVAKMVVRLRKEGVPLERRTRGHVAGRRNKPWTHAEVEYLIRRRAEKATCEEIGLELGRTVSAAAGMVQKLRGESVPVAMLGCGVRRLWDPEALKAMTAARDDTEIIQLGDRRAAAEEPSR